MENILKKIRLGKAQVKPTGKSDLLIHEIREVCARINRAYTLFEMEDDQDLIEAAIFELESLKSRYRYLLKEARERNINCAPFEVIQSYNREDNQLG